MPIIGGKAVIDKEKFVDRACVATPSNDRSLPQVEAVENYILFQSQIVSRIPVQLHSKIILITYIPALD